MKTDGLVRVNSPKSVVVGLRVLVSLLGWSALVGAGCGAVALAIFAFDREPAQAPGFIGLGLAYGAFFGVIWGCVPAVLSAIGAAVTARLTREVADGRVDRVVSVTRGMFVCGAIIVIYALLATHSDSVLPFVIPALAFGAWRSGRAAQRALRRQPRRWTPRGSTGASPLPTLRNG